jgi:hypothetical protein
MELAGKPFVVRAVAGLVDIEKCDDEARSQFVTTNATRGLDILGVCLRLTQNHHQPEAWNAALFLN